MTRLRLCPCGCGKELRPYNGVQPLVCYAIWQRVPHVDRTAMGITGGGVAWAVGVYAQDIGGRNGIPAREDRTRHQIADR